MTPIVEREINGRTYRIQMHGAKEGRKVLARLMQVFGNAASSTRTGDGASALVSGVAGVVKGFTPAEVDYFCDAFAPKTYVVEDGAEVQLSAIFDLHFMGDYGAMLAWLVACIEVNFSGFFVELRALLGKAVGAAIAQAMKQRGSFASLFQKGSTGGSTESPPAGDTTIG